MVSRLHVGICTTRNINTFRMNSEHHTPLPDDVYKILDLGLNVACQLTPEH
jgi:hypothetical protein